MDCEVNQYTSLINEFLGSSMETSAVRVVPLSGSIKGQELLSHVQRLQSENRIPSAIIQTGRFITVFYERDPNSESPDMFSTVLPNPESSQKNSSSTQQDFNGDESNDTFYTLSQNSEKSLSNLAPLDIDFNGKKLDNVGGNSQDTSDTISKNPKVACQGNNSLLNDIESSRKNPNFEGNKAQNPDSPCKNRKLASSDFQSTGQDSSSDGNKMQTSGLHSKNRKLACTDLKSSGKNPNFEGNKAQNPDSPRKIRKLASTDFQSPGQDSCSDGNKMQTSGLHSKNRMLSCTDLESSGKNPNFEGNKAQNPDSPSKIRKFACPDFPKQSNKVQNPEAHCKNMNSIHPDLESTHQKFNFVGNKEQTLEMCHKKRRLTCPDLESTCKDPNFELNKLQNPELYHKNIDSTHPYLESTRQNPNFDGDKLQNPELCHENQDSTHYDLEFTRPRLVFNSSVRKLRLEETPKKDLDLNVTPIPSLSTPIRRGELKNFCSTSQIRLTPIDSIKHHDMGNRSSGNFDLSSTSMHRNEDLQQDQRSEINFSMEDFSRSRGSSKNSSMKRDRVDYTRKEIVALHKGLKLYGKDFRKILFAYKDVFHPKRTPISLYDKWRHDTGFQ